MAKPANEKSRWVPLRYINNKNTSRDIAGVRLAADEEVRWVWRHSMAGSRIVGYAITKKELPEH
jgi:hypothetical protein